MTNLRLIAATALLTSLLASLAAAQDLPVETQLACGDWQSSVQVIAEPWEDNARSFAKGEVRLAVMDTGEPAAGSFFLLIMAPPYGDDGAGRQCRVLSLDGAMGFAGLTLASATVSTETATGLALAIPAQRWLPETDTYVDAVLSVTLDLASGGVRAALD